MYDRETQSLWVHVTGRAETGVRKGWKLTFMPSSMTTWAAWKAAHPDSTVLPGHRREGFMGTYTGLRSPSGIGLAVRVAFAAKLYPFEKLAKQPVVNDRFMEEDIVVVYSKAAGTASAWRRTLGDQVLTFDSNIQDAANESFLIKDVQTGSLWAGLRGEAVSGPLKGQRLEFMSHHPILNGRFAGFYPDGPTMQ